MIIYEISDGNEVEEFYPSKKKAFKHLRAAVGDIDKETCVVYRIDLGKPTKKTVCSIASDRYYANSRVPIHRGGTFKKPRKI